MGPAVDPDGDTLTYDFEVWEGTTTTVLLAEVRGLPASPGGASWTANTPLPEDAGASWRARALDARAAGPIVDDDLLRKPLNVFEMRLRIKAAKRMLNLEDELREGGGTT